MRLDPTQVFATAAKLFAAGPAADAAVGAVVKKGAQNTKTDAAETVRQTSQYGRLRHYPRSITYDVFKDGLKWSAEIGPDKDRRQGALGNIIEYGTSHHGPIAPHLGPALDRESDKLDDHIGDAVEKVLEGLL